MYKQNMMNPQPFNQELIFGDEARQEVKKGLDIVCNAAKITIGPKGRNVFIDREWGPYITNDGVSIITSITLPNKYENMGAHIAKQASAATNDAAGDGTTTTAILLQKLVEESFKSSENPMDLRTSLQEASEVAIEELKKIAIEVKDEDQIRNVAIISAESEKIGNMVSEISQAVGRNALVMVEESQNVETSYEIIEGFEIPKGYVNSAFVNQDNKVDAVYKNVKVLVTDKRISNIGDLFPLLKQFDGKTQELVIFCSDIDNGILNQLLFNKVQGLFQSLVIRANQQELEDIAGLTGAALISETSGVTFEKLTYDQLGTAKKVIANDKKTIVVSDTNADYIVKLYGLVETTTNELEKERYQERIKKLAGKMAVIKVGAPTESDMKYQKLKLDDAVQAVKAAQEQGIVEGGGATLYKLSKLLPNTPGGVILSKALQEPLRQIIRNAGKDESEIISKVNETGKGWDAKNDKYVDLIQEGIIDPAKVEICAIQNAVSAASTLLTTEVAITYKLADYAKEK